MLIEGERRLIASLREATDDMEGGPAVDILKVIVAHMLARPDVSYQQPAPNPRSSGPTDAEMLDWLDARNVDLIKCDDGRCEVRDATTLDGISVGRDGYRGVVRAAMAKDGAAIKVAGPTDAEMWDWVNTADVDLVRLNSIHGGRSVRESKILGRTLSCGYTNYRDAVHAAMAGVPVIIPV